MIASGPQSIPRCAMRTNVKQCLAELLGSLLCWSAHHTSCQDHFSTLDPGSMGCDYPQAHSKQCASMSRSGNSRPTLPVIFGQGPLRLSLIKWNLNWVDWSFSCCAPAPSPRQCPSCPTTQTPIPMSLCLRVFSIEHQQKQWADQFHLLLHCKEEPQNIFRNHFCLLDCFSALGALVEQHPITGSS